MSRSSNSSTDPFNAGAPSFGDDASSSGPDSASSAGSGERPPESWDYDDSSSSSSRDAKRAAEQEKKRQEQARREASQRKGSDYSTTQQSYDSYGGTAQQTTRRASEPKKHHNFGCWFWFIVLFVLPAVFGIVESCTSSSTSSSSSSSSSSDEEENGSLELVQDRIDSLADDEELIGLIADDFDRELIYWTDYDAEGLGLDSTEFAEWFLAEVSFEGSVDADDDEDEGSADLSATERDYDAENDFVTTVRDYLDSEDLDYFSLDELDETQQAEIQTLYDEMLESYDTDVSDYTNFRFDLVQDDGEWEIDEDSFEEELYETFINSDVGGEVDYEERDNAIECVNLVYSRLSTLSEDEELHAYLVEEFNDYLELYAHYGAEELGIDADAFADWYLANVWYTTDYVDAESSYMVEVEVCMMRVDYDAWWDFGDEVEAYLDEQDVSYYSGQALTDAQKEHVQGLYDDFIASYDLEDEDEYVILDFEFSEEDGEWVLDEDVYQSEMEYALDM